MEIIYTVLAIVACVLLFSFAIFIHEFGHFVAARLLGLRVDRFSIGFGPALWKKTIKGIEYRISAIPFGGYVALPQLDPEGTDALQGGTENKAPITEIPAWKRVIVAFAGPFGNIVLAIVLAFALAAIPSARFGETPPVVGAVLPEGNAEKAGFEEGDRILSVDGQKIADWNDVNVAAALSAGREVPVVISRAGVEKTLRYRAVHSEVLDSYLFDADATHAACVGSVISNSPAAKAGLLPGDVVTAVDGRSISTFAELRAAVKRHGSGELEIKVTRETTNLVLRLNAEFDQAAGRPLIGCVVAQMDSAASWMPNRKPFEQLKWDAGQIFRVLKGLVTPKESKAVAGALGGPVMIAQVLYKHVRRNIWDAFGFLRFININLAILNLLPIPVLDGGLIFFALIELFFRRKVSRKLVNNLSFVFMWFFLGLMVLLVWRDVARGRRVSQAASVHERQAQETEAQLKAEKGFVPAFDLRP